MIFKKKDYILEENIKIPTYGTKISKQLKVFYNPEMKINRDISLLVIDSYFDKKIKFCDPMVASGVRELRFLKTIPNKFEKLYLGDISKTAIKNCKKNFKANNLNMKRCEFFEQQANETIGKEFYDFIEIDPFGSPVPFLDIACQKIKHKGVLSVTATDTAALCGTYPKTCIRKYGIKVEMTLWHEELGLRNLIAYVQRQLAKYEKTGYPMISFSNKHFFKIFFKVEEGRNNAVDMIKNLKNISWDKKSQEVKVLDYENENSLGKTYIGPLNDKQFLKSLNIDLIKDNKEVSKLIDKLNNEIDLVGYYNPHKFEKEFKFSTSKKFESICDDLKEKGFEVSRPHNNRLGIKTNANSKEFVKIMKD